MGRFLPFSTHFMPSSTKETMIFFCNTTISSATLYVRFLSITGCERALMDRIRNTYLKPFLWPLKAPHWTHFEVNVEYEVIESICVSNIVLPPFEKESPLCAWNQITHVLSKAQPRNFCMDNQLPFLEHAWKFNLTILKHLRIMNLDVCTIKIWNG